MTEQVSSTGQMKTLIHYVFQTTPERIACMPHRIDFSCPVPQLVTHRTNAKNGVTCYACKQTQEYKNG